MNQTAEDGLAETMIVLTGEGARPAAARFADECHARNDKAMAALWERVVDALDAASQPAARTALSAEPAAPLAETRGVRAAPLRRFAHALYETCVPLPDFRFAVRA